MSRILAAIACTIGLSGCVVTAAPSPHAVYYPPPRAMYDAPVYVAPPPPRPYYAAPAYPPRGWSGPPPRAYAPPHHHRPPPGYGW